MMLFLLFALTVVGWSGALIEWYARRLHEDRDEIKLESYKKVGAWYEKRVEELEHEAQQLAAQLVESGRVPIAMPIPPSEPPGVYASDPTGLIVERLDEYDLPVS
jgi:hypothetical protein